MGEEAGWWPRRDHRAMTSPATERVRFTPRSLLIAVGMFGATLAGLKLFASASRIVGWVLTAAVVAAVLYPLVAALSRWMPRSAAVLVVLFVTIGSLGVVTWRLVDTVVTEYHSVQVSAPQAAGSSNSRSATARLPAN